MAAFSSYTKIDLGKCENVATKQYLLLSEIDSLFE